MVAEYSSDLLLFETSVGAGALRQLRAVMVQHSADVVCGNIQPGHHVFKHLLSRLFVLANRVDDWSKKEAKKKPVDTRQTVDRTRKRLGSVWAGEHQEVSKN